MRMKRVAFPEPPADFVDYFVDELLGGPASSNGFQDVCVCLILAMQNISLLAVCC